MSRLPKPWWNKQKNTWCTEIGGKRHERQVLDIYTSERAADGSLPVMFWIHGGGWQVGDKSDVELKPKVLTERGFVFVSTNYRLLPDVEIDVLIRDVAKSLIDQNNSKRMASFSLDGLAGWTVDGMNWMSFTNNGRNWDFGSVDWSAALPKTIIVARHETSPPGEVNLSTDSGVTWSKLAIRLSEDRNQVSMVGALDATTLVYSNGQGIHRSTDTGATWTQVSEANPLTRIPVLFGGVHYLGTASGLLVSKDKGATWQPQGAACKIQLGPFFGADENTMVVVGSDGAHLTEDAGRTWTRVAGLKPAQGGFGFATNWFGCYAWDPVNNILYASAMGNPVFQLEL